MFCGAYFNVELVDPDGQVGVGVQIEVVNSLLHSVEDVREGLVVKHAGFQRPNLKIDLLLNQQEVIHLAATDTRDRSKSLISDTKKQKHPFCTR